MAVRKIINTKKNNEIVDLHFDEFKCFHCNMTKKETEFYNSNSEIYSSKMPICKECVVGIFKELNIEYGSPHKAILRICSLLDVFFYKDIIDDLESKVKESKTLQDRYIIQQYLKQINSLVQYKNRTFKDSDMMAEVTHIKDIGLHGKSEDAFIWGSGQTQEQYDRLNERYAIWCQTSPHGCEGDRATLRDICRLELQRDKAFLKGKEITKDAKEIQNLIKSAGLDGASRRKNEAEDKTEDTLGTVIELMEKTMPADAYNDKKLYADFAGRKKYYEDYYIRPLRNMVKNERNFHIEEYEQ